MNFWTSLNKSFFALAPMEDVTDTAFRELILSISSNDHLKLLFTEFTSVDGLCSQEGRSAVSHRLKVSNQERALLNKNKQKIIVQIWGSDPEKFFKAAKFISENYNFSGIDINMGCPVKKVVKNRSCSALIDFPDLATEIIQATKEATELPVSVKTRIGFNKIETERWISQLISAKPAAITVHGRTQRMLSKGNALWDEIGKAAQVRNNLDKEIVLIGNGDVLSVADGLHKINEYGVDGIMVGRGIFQNPWMFSPPKEQSVREKIELLKKHIELYEATWNTSKNYNILKRFFKIYINNFAGASQLRQKFMETYKYKDAYKLLDSEQIQGFLN